VNTALIAPVLSSALIGFVLGCLGGGGSILAVPMLVFVAGLPTTSAVGTSLAMIAVASLLASWAHYRRGRVRLDAALAFGLPGAAAAWVGGQATALVPEAVLLAALAAVMLGVGGWTLLARPHGNRAPASRSRAVRLPASMLAGAGIGLLTGFLGVGGGFLVVPALVAFAGLGLREAIGTSLLVMAFNSGAGVLSHFDEGHVQPALLAALTLATAVGALTGERAASSLPTRKLRRGFAGVVLATGLGVALASLKALQAHPTSSGHLRTSRP
jgi:uncharacterized membrane protein YfcA